MSGDSLGCQLADEVLNYLIRHPEAQDTVEGIVEWWLLERRAARALGEVKAALEDLVARDFVLADRSKDGRIHYKLNREKEREIRRYLRNPMQGRKTKTGGSNPDV